MFIDPHAGESIEINNKFYTFVEAVNAPGIIYAEIGRKAKVYQLQSEECLFALKAFKPRYRLATNINHAEQIAKYKNIPGLAVANRLVVSPETHLEIIKQNSAFSYSILMPWMEGRSWFNFVTGKVPVSVTDSKRLAKAFINIVFELEKHGLAHCDLSSSNFVFSPDFNHVELIDIEDMFGHGLKAPKENPKGTGGYAPDWMKIDGTWEAGADRFSSSILVSEILGWQFEDIRDASSGDAYFADGEFGHKSKRFRLLSERLEQIHPELSNLFKTAWYAESLEECPRIADWKQVLDSIQPEDKQRLSKYERQQTERAESEQRRAVMLLAPTVPEQKNQYKLYVISNGLFGGYIKVDGSLTAGKNPFDIQEISQGVGFDTINNAIEWARENDLQVVNKGKVSEGNRGYAIASLVIGGFVLCFALTIVAADPSDAGMWSSMLLFFVLAGFLIVSGLSNIQKPK